ncbi:MAG: AAA-like domain-containing protein, partial [Scytonema sp. PMC 1069.18]|nr:AAA-like domain-containing protein [Scytonema sp. PMC 1069.18]
YVTREADRRIIELLNNGEYCYVFNCHQMGKSSLQAHTSAKLQNEGFAWILTDLTGIVSSKIDEKEWYKTLIYEWTKVHTTDNSELLAGFDLTNWLNEQSQKEQTPKVLLSNFIKEVLLDKIPQEQKLVIFIDEIGQLINLDFSDDFLFLIRNFYTRRDDDKEFKRLTFVLLGVTTPQKLLKNNTGVLNIGESIDLQGFTKEEAIKGLAKGLEGKAEDCEKVIEAILYWTGGQPFLTQKLCKMVESSSECIKKGNEKLEIDKIVESDIINKWINQDEPMHLRAIEGKVLFKDERQESRLRLYKKILDKDKNQNADDIVKLELRLSGLVIEKDQKLELYNRIYEKIFDKEWVEGKLAELQPIDFIKKFNKWIKSKKDKKYLLTDNELSNALEWAPVQDLSKEENEFLRKSQDEQSKKEKERIIKASILIMVLIVVFIVIGGIGLSISRENNQKQKAQQELIEAQKKAQQELVEAQKKAQQELVEAQKKAQQESVQLIWKLVLGVSIILVIGLVLIIGFMGR